MSITRFSLFSLLLLVVACNNKETVPHFDLTITTVRDSVETRYMLTEKSLVLVQLSTDSARSDSASVFQSVLSETDTLKMIALLDVRSYSCPEQHLLDVQKIVFKNDSATTQVDPNINHPVELDYAVRLINGIVPEEFMLHFIDMQPAIEPTGKMQL